MNNLHDALKALNKAAYDAIRAGRDTTAHPMLDRQALREIAWATDKLVDDNAPSVAHDSDDALTTHFFGSN